MGETINGIEAVTRHDVQEVVINGEQRRGVGLMVAANQGDYWLWVCDGSKTLAVQMTSEEVGHFAIALGAFPHSGFPEAAWKNLPVKPRASIGSWLKALFS
jgi:hypothetical protein